MKSKYSKKFLILLGTVSIIYGFTLLIQPEPNNNTKIFYSSASFQSGFSIELHKNFKVDGKSIFDFDIYHFSLNGKTILSSYLGWAPSFPHQNPADKEETTFNVDGWLGGLVGGFKTKCFTYKDKQYALECLVDFDDQGYGPQYIHFWGNYGNESERAHGMEIIRSTKRWRRD